MSEAQDPILEAYWAKILADWADEARHKQFVAYCAQTAQLPEAALRYRGIAKPGEPVTPIARSSDASDSPAEAPAEDAEAVRRADAQKRLEGVAAAAVLVIANEPRTEPIDAKKLGRKLGLGFLAVVFAVLAYLMWVVFGAR